MRDPVTFRLQVDGPVAGEVSKNPYISEGGRNCQTFWLEWLNCQKILTVLWDPRTWKMIKPKSQMQATSQTGRQTSQSDRKARRKSDLPCAFLLIRSSTDFIFANHVLSFHQWQTKHSLLKTGQPVKKPLCTDYSLLFLP